MDPKNNWIESRWYCNNCGRLVTGYRNKEGTYKATCLNCNVVMVRKLISRRHDEIHVFAPKIK